MNKQILGPLNPPPTEVGTRSLPKHPTKLPSKVITREPSHGSHVIKVERLGVPGIHKIPSPPKMHHQIGTHKLTLARKPTEERAPKGFGRPQGQPSQPNQASPTKAREVQAAMPNSTP